MITCFVVAPVDQLVSDAGTRIYRRSGETGIEDGVIPWWEVLLAAFFFFFFRGREASDVLYGV